LRCSNCCSAKYHVRNRCQALFQYFAAGEFE